MLDEFEYTIAWSVYILAALGLMAVWWRLTYFIGWRVLRQLFRVMIAVPLVVPIQLDADSPEWVPAIFVWLFDEVLLHKEDSGQVITVLITALVCAAVLWVLDTGVWLLWQKYKPFGQKQVDSGSGDPKGRAPIKAVSR